MITPTQCTAVNMNTVMTVYSVTVTADKSVQKHLQYHARAYPTANLLYPTDHTLHKPLSQKASIKASVLCFGTAPLVSNARSCTLDFETIDRFLKPTL